MKRSNWIPTLLIIGTTFTGCGRGKDSPISKSTPPGPNIVLITLDTTRADRLGCYGHQGAKTPSLDQLAREGIRFSHAYTVVPLTLPSHASLLTGLVPRATGLHINSAGPGGGMLAPEIPTLATVLKARGYQTAAFVSAMVLGKHFGLNNGFDVYDDDIEHKNIEVPSEALHLERSAKDTCDKALTWLSRPRDGSFFIWVHFFDPHLAYEPPPPFDKELADRYDGEIAYMDSQIARLVAHIDHSGKREQTLIVVAGDHGESLGEHGEKDHGYFVYNATLHVPLIWSFGDRIPKGKVVDAPVGLIDLFPTALGLLEFPVPSGINGRDLAGTWQSGTWEPLPVYAESEYSRWSFGWAPLYTLISTRWKYIESPRAELYDLEQDPHELNNIVAEHTDLAQNLSGALRTLVAQHEVRDALPVSDADAAKRHLSGLGYAGSTSNVTAKRSSSEARDPKDMLSLYHELMAAMSRLEARDFLGTVAILEPLLAKPIGETGLSEHAYDDSLTNLADAYFKLERYEDALAAYRRSLRSAPDDPARLTAVSLSLHKLGRTAESIAGLAMVLKIAPEWIPAHRELAAMHTEQRDFARALPHWKRFAELSPDSVPALTNLGSTQLALGNPKEALAPLLQALQLDPNNEFIYRSLWQVLVVTGKRTEAIALLRDAHRRFPNRPPFICPLARLLAVTPGLSAADREEGLRLAQRCAGSDTEDARLFDTLAAAFASIGKFDKAIGMAELALESAAKKNDVAQQQAIAQHLELFRAGKSLTE